MLKKGTIKIDEEFFFCEENDNCIWQQSIFLLVPILHKTSERSKCYILLHIKICYASSKIW